MKKKIILTSTILLASLALVGCSTNQSAKSENSSLRAENSSLKKSENINIVGSYKDSQDGAAITLNSNGTGRYVYADPVNSDTDDQLTWKKSSDGSYEITLQDSNVTSPLTGKLSGKMLTLSGDSNWNTETFRKAKNNLDLDEFLAQSKSNKGSQTPQTANSSATNETSKSSGGHPRLADGTDVYSLPLSDPRNPDGYKQAELMDIAGDPKYHNPDGSMNAEGEALSSSIEATFHQPE